MAAPETPQDLVDQTNVCDCSEKSEKILRPCEVNLDENAVTHFSAHPADCAISIYLFIM